MHRIAMIVNGAVENISMWDGYSVWLPGEKYILIDVTDSPQIGPGWLFIDGEFIDPYVPPTEEE